MQTDAKSPFFVAAIGMIPFLLLYTFSLPFLKSQISVAATFMIGIFFALAIMLVAFISKVRQEPARRRAIALIFIMTLYELTMTVGWILLAKS